MTIKIFTDRNNVDRKVGEAELIFDEGPLAGMTLRGFGIWKHPRGGYNVTVPSRPDRRGGGTNYWFLISSSEHDLAALDRLRAEIVDAYVQEIRLNPPPSRPETMRSAPLRA